jgi:Transposase
VPSLIPIKSGDRVKTDRRDAMMLARLHRAGELTGVWVPDAAHEAMRDLARARATAIKVLSKARQHLGGFLLRHGKIYNRTCAFQAMSRTFCGTASSRSYSFRLTRAYMREAEGCRYDRDRTRWPGLSGPSPVRFSRGQFDNQNELDPTSRSAANYRPSPRRLRREAGEPQGILET